MTLGTMGMPKGFSYDPNCDHEPNCVSRETANSELYFAGHMIASSLPVTGEISDARDGIQNLVNGNYVDASINAIGLFAPFVGGKAVSKGMDIAGGRMDDMTIKLTDDMSFLDDFTDGAITSLKNKGFSEKYIQTAKQKGYNPKKMDKLIVEKNVPREDVRYYIDKEVPLRWVEDLRMWGIETDIIRKFIERMRASEYAAEKGVDYYGKARSYCSWEKAQPGNPNLDIRDVCQTIK